MSKPVFERLKLESFRPRRRRRDWRGTLVTLLTLLALSALAGWLWSCVKSASIGQGAWRMEPGALPLAMVSASEGFMIAGVLLFAAGLAIVATIKARHEDPELSETKPVPFEVVEEDPLSVPAPGPELMPRGLQSRDVVEILKAVGAELQLTRNLVRSAGTSLSVEDYGDALAGCERRLGDLRVTVWELRARFEGTAQGAESMAHEGHMKTTTDTAQRVPTDQWATAKEREVVS